MPNQKDPNYPAMRWNPANGDESDVFQSEDEVPEGWLDHHPDDTAKGGAGQKAAVEHRQPSGGRRRGTAPVKDAVDPDLGTGDDTPMTREEVVTALQEGKVRFNKEASDEDLTAQLVAALQGVLTKRNVAFDPAASPRALLALVRA